MHSRTISQVASARVQACGVTIRTRPSGTGPSGLPRRGAGCVSNYVPSIHHGAEPAGKVSAVSAYGQIDSVPHRRRKPNEAEG